MRYRSSGCYTSTNIVALNEQLLTQKWQLNVRSFRPVDLTRIDHSRVKGHTPWAGAWRFLVDITTPRKGSFHMDKKYPLAGFTYEWDP